MGYGVYEDRNHDRWAGYGVVATCEEPACWEKIDRGMAYRCGEEPGAEQGCGLFFCSEHLYFTPNDDDPQMCLRCCDHAPPYEPKPERPEWVEHLLTDESWAKWREENPAKVAEMRGAA